MKIDNSRPDFDPRVGADKADKADGVQKSAAADKARQAAQVARSAGGDKVNVSPDAQLASKAIAAAREASDVRPDVVARAKELLADGKVGSDPDKLADAMLKGLLDS
ncbi:MAG: flagellar biosynthesis anti-sigma factor FlgM [Vicinamibacterales bacterium]